MSHKRFSTIDLPLSRVFFFRPLRYEPTMDIPTDISTETDRVLFIKAVAEFMVTLFSEFAL